MADTSANDAPRLFPTMRCRDPETMMRWLTGVLGFSEHFAHRSGGIVEHAQMAFGSSILMLGQSRDDSYGEMIGDIDGRRTDALYLAVNDVDAVFDKVKTSGSTIETEVKNTDYGSREFACRDPEGNLWSIGDYWPTAKDARAQL